MTIQRYHTKRPAEGAVGLNLGSTWSHLAQQLFLLISWSFSIKEAKPFAPSQGYLSSPSESNTAPANGVLRHLRGREAARLTRSTIGEHSMVCLATLYFFLLFCPLQLFFFLLQTKTLNGSAARRPAEAPSYQTDASFQCWPIISLLNISNSTKIYLRQQPSCVISVDCKDL